MQEDEEDYHDQKGKGSGKPRPKCNGAGCADVCSRPRCDFTMCARCCSLANNNCRLHNERIEGYTGGVSVKTFEKRERARGVKHPHEKEETRKRGQGEKGGKRIHEEDGQTRSQDVSAAGGYKAAPSMLQRQACALSDLAVSEGQVMPVNSMPPTSGAKHVADGPKKLRDIREALSCYQREAEEVRLWRQSVWLQGRRGDREVYVEAVERYCENARLLKRVFTASSVSGVDPAAQLAEDVRSSKLRTNEALLKLVQTHGGDGSSPPPSMVVGDDRAAMSQVELVKTDGGDGSSAPPSSSETAERLGQHLESGPQSSSGLRGEAVPQPSSTEPEAGAHHGLSYSMNDLATQRFSHQVSASGCAEELSFLKLLIHRAEGKSRELSHAVDVSIE